MSAPFQNVLVAVALWQAAELLPQRVVTGSEMAVAGLVSGLCWGLLARLGANAVAEVVGAVLSAAALAAFVGSAWSGNECLGVEARVGLYAVVATVVGTAAVAALVAMTQWATLRRASLGSYALAIVGLVELAQFAVAPTGEVLDAVPWWAWPIGVTGFCAVAFLTAVNPRAATSLVGAMVALSIPTFWFGLVGIYVFSLELGWLPAGNMYTIGDGSALDYLHEHANALAGLPVWLFSSGPIGKMGASDEEPVDLVQLREDIRTEGDIVFGGKLDRHRLQLAEKAVVVALRSPDGDFRDWDAIAEWSHAIAAALLAGAHR